LPASAGTGFMFDQEMAIDVCVELVSILRGASGVAGRELRATKVMSLYGP
jgi:hypothetical protein